MHKLCQITSNRYFCVWQSGERTCSSYFERFWNKQAFFTYFVSVLYKTNRFYVAVCLFGNRSQKTSKCGKNIGDTLGYRLVCHFFVLTTFWRHLWWSVISCKLRLKFFDWNSWRVQLFYWGWRPHSSKHCCCYEKQLFYNFIHPLHVILNLTFIQWQRYSWSARLRSLLLSLSINSSSRIFCKVKIEINAVTCQFF